MANTASGPVYEAATMGADEQPSSRSSYANGAAFSQPYPAQYGKPHHQTMHLGNKSKTGFQSEHGHSLDKINPMTKHSGASVASFLTGLFQTMLGVATLGASITFSYVLSNGGQQLLPSQTDLHFSARTIQLFLSISWLLFLLTLAFASLGSTLLAVFKRHWQEDWDGLHGKTSQLQVQWYAVIANITIGSLIIAAFVFLDLVVVSYSPVVGWLALAFTILFAVVIIIAIFNQIPWPWQLNTPDSPTHREEV